MEKIERTLKHILTVLVVFLILWAFVHSGPLGRFITSVFEAAKHSLLNVNRKSPDPEAGGGRGKDRGGVAPFNPCSERKASMLVDLQTVKGRCPLCSGMKGADGDKDVFQVTTQQGYNGLACPPHLLVLVQQHKETATPVKPAQAPTNGPPSAVPVTK